MRSVIHLPLILMLSTLCAAQAWADPLPFPITAPGDALICGDASGDGVVNVLDVVSLVGAVLDDGGDDITCGEGYCGAAPPACVDVAGADGILIVLDIVSVVGAVLDASPLECGCVEALACDAIDNCWDCALADYCGGWQIGACQPNFGWGSCPVMDVSCYTTTEGCDASNGGTSCSAYTDCDTCASWGCGWQDGTCYGPNWWMPGLCPDLEAPCIMESGECKPEPPPTDPCEECIASGNAWIPDLNECLPNCWMIMDVSCYTGSCPAPCGGDSCGTCFGQSDC